MPQSPSVAARPQLERDAIRGDLLGAQARLTQGAGRPSGNAPVVAQLAGQPVGVPQLPGLPPIQPLPAMQTGAPYISGQTPPAPGFPEQVGPTQAEPGMGTVPASLPNDPCTLLQGRLAALVQLMTPLGQELGSAIAAIDPADALTRQGVRPTTLQEILDEPETLSELARFVEEDVLSGRAGANPDLGALQEVADNARALQEDPMFGANVAVFDHLRQATETLYEEGRASGCLPDAPAIQSPQTQASVRQRGR